MQQLVCAGGNQSSSVSISHRILFVFLLQSPAVHTQLALCFRSESVIPILDRLSLFCFCISFILVLVLLLVFDPSSASSGKHIEHRSTGRQFHKDSPSHLPTRTMAPSLLRSSFRAVQHALASSPQGNYCRQRRLIGCPFIHGARGGVRIGLARTQCRRQQDYPLKPGRSGTRAQGHVAFKQELSLA